MRGICLRPIQNAFQPYSPVSGQRVIDFETGTARAFADVIPGGL
jgi:hypothetical protein